MHPDLPDSFFNFDDDQQPEGWHPDSEDEILMREPLPGPPPADLREALTNLRLDLETKPLASLRSKAFDDFGEWRGSDVVVTADLLACPNPECVVSSHDLMVRTQHASALAWMFDEIFEIFGNHLDAGNRYAFYGKLANAALRVIGSRLPEPSDHRMILRAVHQLCLQAVDLIEEQGCLPEQSAVVFHGADAEGRQWRMDAATGKPCT